MAAEHSRGNASEFGEGHLGYSFAFVLGCEWRVGLEFALYAMWINPIHLGLDLNSMPIFINPVHDSIAGWAMPSQRAASLAHCPKTHGTFGIGHGGYQVCGPMLWTTWGSSEQRLSIRAGSHTRLFCFFVSGT